MWRRHVDHLRDSYELPELKSTGDDSSIPNPEVNDDDVFPSTRASVPLTENSSDESVSTPPNASVTESNTSNSCAQDSRPVAVSPRYPRRNRQRPNRLYSKFSLTSGEPTC